MGKEIALVKQQRPVLTDEQQHLIHSAEMLGGLKAVSAVARSFDAACSAQSFRALQHFAQLKGHEAYGFDRFDDFLNLSPRSPMTKSQYYERLAIIDSEGDATFDALNALRVPISKRKLLAAGGVKLDGDDLMIGEERFPINDRQAVVAAVKHLADTAAEQSKAIEKGRKANDKKKDIIADLKDKLSRGGVFSADSTPHARALVSVLGDFQLLSQEVEAIEDETERQRFGAVTLEHLAQATIRLEKALGFEQPSDE